MEPYLEPYQTHCMQLTHKYVLRIIYTINLFSLLYHNFMVLSITTYKFFICKKRYIFIKKYIL